MCPDWSDLEVSQMCKAYLVMAAFMTLAFFVGLNIMRIKFDYFGGANAVKPKV